MKLSSKEHKLWLRDRIDDLTKSKVWLVCSLIKQNQKCVSSAHLSNKIRSVCRMLTYLTKSEVCVVCSLI